MTHTTSLANNFLPRICVSRRAGVGSARTSDVAFACIAALLFMTNAALTIVWCGSMAAMGGMPMPGGWTMSMAWMRMPGETWAGAAASFTGMWSVMMMAMMLPSLAPMLWRYRKALDGASEAHKEWLTTIAGGGYFFVWTLFGMAVYPLGVALAAVEMGRPGVARAVPIATGLIVLAAGALQFTKWKAHHLTGCREAPGQSCALPAEFSAAWRQGLHFGLDCGLSCANLTAVLLVLGVMDLHAMAAVTAAITAERLAPAGERVARAIGCVVAGAGLILIARAAVVW